LIDRETAPRREQAVAQIAPVVKGDARRLAAGGGCRCASSRGVWVYPSSDDADHSTVK